MTSRTWLITGVSSGFGRELTTQLLDRGDTVIGTVRRPDAVADLADKHPDTLNVEILDVTDGTPSARWSTASTTSWAGSTSWSATPATACSARPRN